MYLIGERNSLRDLICENARVALFKSTRSGQWRCRSSCSQSCYLSPPRQIEEDNDRRITDRGIMAGEDQAACFAVHAEDGDVVAALIARVKELAGGIEIEAARIVPTCPFLSDEGQFTGFADGKDPNAVVQTVARIDKAAIRGNQ